MKPSSIKTLSVNVSDTTKLNDGIVTHKLWFNGLKKFFTVKLLPPKQ